MTEVSLDVTSESLEINSYDGNSAKKIAYRPSSSQKYFLPIPKWNFFRKENNHAYVKGSVFYEGDCKNNLIISPYLNNRLVNVKDAFVFIEDSSIEVSPISDISNAIDKGKRKLSNQKIDYHIPESVFKRENLIEKDLKSLKKEVKQIYGIEPKEISAIESGRTKNGIYYIRAEDGKEYILKFRGKHKEKAELLSQIAKNIPNYFPLNFCRRDSSSFTFKIGEELYGLEEFIRDISPKIRDIRYFSLLGSHMGLLHNHFSNFLRRNKWIEEELVPTGSHTSESNLISFYFDLATDKIHNTVLISELERIIEKDLNNQMISLPMALIHGDLNYSNLIWQGNNPKIVDSETIKNSNRLNEFKSPLLFGGNMAKPKYIKNSMEVMIRSYNQSSDVLLSKEEINVLPFLLRYALLRNFVVRKIRRSVDDEHYLGEIIENLKLIEEGSQ